MSRQAQIDQLRAQIAALESDRFNELKEREAALEKELAEVRAELAQTTGKPAPAKRRGRKAGGVGSSGGKNGSPEALKAALAKADGQKLNRKGLLEAGISLKAAIAIAKGDKSFGYEQNRAQGSVWLK